jgi:hypothetical protein
MLFNLNWDYQTGASLTEERIHLLIAVGAFFGYGGLGYIGWMYLRDGRALLAGQEGAFRSAMHLSYLMLLFFPLTLLGAYCIVQLRRNKRAFEVNVAVDPTIQFDRSDSHAAL